MMKQLLTFVLCMSLVPAISSAQAIVKTITQPFNGSGGVRVDQSGNIYVADFGTALNNADGTTVSKITPTGNIQTWASGLVGASGCDFGPKGNLYQSNISAGRVSKISPLGFVGTFSTGHGGPVGVAVDSSENVYVAECGANLITKVDRFGNKSIHANSGLLNCPNGLVLGPDDKTLYCCNFGNGNVLRIDSMGNTSILVTLPGRNNGHLTYANGVLYVVDRGGNQIYEVGLDGTSTLLAGTGQRGNVDGPANQATFSVPNGIDASPTGDTLYINDAITLVGPNLNPVLLRMIILNRSTAIEEKAAFTEGILANAPNPFETETVVHFRVNSPKVVRLTLWDMMGKKVKTITDRHFSTGDHTVVLEKKMLSAGAYFLKMETENEYLGQKLIQKL